MLYDHIFLVRTLAAAFWTNCSLFIEDAGQPANKEITLNYSNLV